MLTLAQVEEDIGIPADTWHWITSFLACVILAVALISVF